MSPWVSPRTAALSGGFNGGLLGSWTADGDAYAGCGLCAVIGSQRVSRRVRFRKERAVNLFADNANQENTGKTPLTFRGRAQVGTVDCCAAGAA